MVREVRAQHEQQVAVGQRLGGGTPPQQPRHPHTGRVVDLEDVLAPVGERHRRLQRLGQPQHLFARLAGALAAVDDDLLGARHQLHRLRQRGIRGPADRPIGEDRVAQHLVLDLLGRDVARDDDHAHPALEDRRLERELRDAGHLAGRREQGAVVGAAREDGFGVGLLEVAAADLGAGDVGGDREDRCAVALAVVQPVDEVQASGARGSQHRGGTSGDLGVGTRGEGAGLLVADVDELDVGLVPAQRVDDRVRRVADDAVHLPDAGFDHLVDKNLRDGLRHHLLLCQVRVRRSARDG